VRDLPPAARARASALTVRAKTIVSFDARLTADPDDARTTLTFCWSTGDGWLFSGETAARRFDRPGKFRVTLTVTDGQGASSTDHVDITVLESTPGGELQYRPVAIGLAAAAVMLFAAAFFLVGRAKGPPPAKTAAAGRAGPAGTRSRGSPGPRRSDGRAT
jgi:hypothetical protein